MVNHQPWFRRKVNKVTDESNAEEPMSIEVDAPNDTNANDIDPRDFSMGVTSVGDPIAPNSYARTGGVNDVLSSAISAIKVVAEASANVSAGVVDTAAGITTDSAARINDLAQQLLDELNKAQQKLI